MTYKWKDKLEKLKSTYGKDVMYTDGLYHIIDKDHNEIYINNKTLKLDNRALYNTLVVTDKVIIAKTVNSKDTTYVILNKETFKCIYKTKGTIHYIDKNIVYDINKDKCTIISHTGKKLAIIPNIDCIYNIHNNQYVVQSKTMFKDMVVYYNKHRDILENLTDGKDYLIHKVDSSENEVEIVNMSGGTYIYNFITRKFYNSFTQEIEEDTQLWKIV